MELKNIFPLYYKILFLLEFKIDYILVHFV